jgi:hypothetical protein
MNMKRSGKSYVSEFLEVLKSQRLEGAGTSVEYILRCTHEKMYIVVKRTHPNARLNFQAQISPCSHTWRLPILTNFHREGQSQENKPFLQPSSLLPSSINTLFPYQLSSPHPGTLTTHHASSAWGLPHPWQKSTCSSQGFPHLTHIFSSSIF